MATHWRETQDLDEVGDTADAIASGLEAHAQTQNLAQPWNQLTHTIDTQHQAVRQARRTVKRAQVQRDVALARLKDEASAFGRAVVDASGGKRAAAPYTDFFDKHAPSAVVTFGVQDQLAAVQGWLDTLPRSAGGALASAWQPRLAAARSALSDASTEVDRADAALTQQLKVGQGVVRASNLALDTLEGDLKKTFPGQPGQIAAFLAPTRKSSPGRKGDAKKSDGSDPKSTDGAAPPAGSESKSGDGAGKSEGSGSKTGG
jgi:hypothetical protein